jgi:acetyl esterase/lipase
MVEGVEHGSRCDPFRAATFGDFTAMTRLAVCLIGLCSATTSLLAADEKPVLKLWPDGLPPGAKAGPAERVAQLEKENDPERIAYVAEPTLTLYRPAAEKANGCAVVVCPGGGYNILAWNKEGLEIADWFNTFGVTAAVLKYRVPRRDLDQPHVEPLQDAQRAIRMVRQHAEEWKVDPQRVGVLGFSAGGHLTVMTGTQWDRPAYEPRDAVDKLNCRPDFLMPIYVAYLGEKYDDRQETRLSPLVRITKETPPTFMAVTHDDAYRGVQSALLLVELKKAGVPAELHVYTKGGHGYGLRPTGNPVSNWPQRAEEWMRASGLLGGETIENGGGGR